MPDPSSSLPLVLTALVLGYLLGSVPFGIVVTRLAGLRDPRDQGSGNIGATNVARTGGKLLGGLTLVLDAGKGAAAAALAMLWSGDAALMAAYGAILGHLFPVWLRFRGGKGVATTLGVHLVIAWPVGVAACLTWALVAGAARMSSLAALISLGLAPVYAWLLTGEQELITYTLIVATIVWARHAGNIKRLVRGTEPKMGGRQ
jgi:glycerol-3-phosphate acyltransferase PlsY